MSAIIQFSTLHKCVNLKSYFFALFSLPAFPFPSHLESLCTKRILNCEKKKRRRKKWTHPTAFSVYHITNIMRASFWTRLLLILKGGFRSVLKKSLRFHIVNSIRRNIKFFFHHLMLLSIAYESKRTEKGIHEEEKEKKLITKRSTHLMLLLHMLLSYAFKHNNKKNWENKYKAKRKCTTWN